MSDHRTIYHGDIVLFALLATPGLNAWLTRLLLGFGNQSVSAEFLTPFVGLVGCLGLGFALLRLSAQDSRRMLAISFAVKLVAGIWLVIIGSSGISPAFYLFGAADLISALILLIFLVKG